MDASAFLEHPRLHKLYVVFGDEGLLRRLVLKAIREVVLGKDGGEEGISYSTHDGAKASFASVMDEAQTVPFFGDRRLVVVQDADDFVSDNRAALEKAVGHLSSVGVLVLDVKSWPSNTRLAKMVDAAATVVCKAPPAKALPQWCVKWAATQYGKQFEVPAANLLVELVDPELGLFDQELLKLSIYVSDRKRITVDDVDKLVGRSRAQNTWKIFDAIGTGNSKEALTILDRLLDQGEPSMRLLGAFSKQLRQLAQAFRLTLLGRPLPVALQEAGVPPFGLRQAEQLVKHLGQRRLNQLYDWLLKIDQDVKGGSDLSEQTLLEALTLRLANRL